MLHEQLEPNLHEQFVAIIPHTRAWLKLLAWMLAAAWAWPVAAWCQESASVDWEHPETIDIYDVSTGDFLDADLAAQQRIWAEQGWQAYHSGENEAAIRYFLVVAHLGPHGSNPLYNVARCYGRLGKAELAARYLHYVVEREFDNVEFMATDPDFSAVRDAAEFTQALAELRAQVQDKRAAAGKVVYVEAPMFLRCRLHFPPDYDPSLKYPLLIVLHGQGANPESYGLIRDRLADPSLILAIPQAPYATASVNTTGYSWAWDAAGEQLPKRSAQRTNDYIGQVIEQLTSLLQSDSVYLMGHSQGGCFAYQGGIVNHDLLDGIIVVGGWLEENWFGPAELQAASHLPVFVAHGSNDGMIGIDRARAAGRYLSENGFDVSFFEFAGAHNVPAEAVQAAQSWINDD